MADNEDDEHVAAWEALLLPNWRWEAFKKEDDGLYYGRVKSPKTYDNWEWGYFSQEQLEEARAYRVDQAIDDNEPVFPDGGYREPVSLYKASGTNLDDELNGEYQSKE